MKRRNFLTTTLAAGLTANALESLAAPDRSLGEGTKPFIVKASKARFSDYNPMGVLKVSGNDTNGEYCLFETKNDGGPWPDHRCTCTSFRTKCS